MLWEKMTGGKPPVRTYSTASFRHHLLQQSHQGGPVAKVSKCAAHNMTDLAVPLNQATINLLRPQAHHEELRLVLRLPRF